MEKRLDVGKYALTSESERNDPRKFQVQYGETDFNFMQRLMEEWGIYWFFEHSDGKHRLVLCDHIGAHRRVRSEAYHKIEYHPNDSKIDIEHIAAFSVHEALRTGRVEVDDYDFTRSRARLLQANQQPRRTTWADRDVFEWPSDFTDARHGDMISRVRMEEARAEGARAFGHGNVRGSGLRRDLRARPSRAPWREPRVPRGGIDADADGGCRRVWRRLSVPMPERA